VASLGGGSSSPSASPVSAGAGGNGANLPGFFVGVIKDKCRKAVRSLGPKGI